MFHRNGSRACSPARGASPSVAWRRFGARAAVAVGVLAGVAVSLTFPAAPAGAVEGITNATCNATLTQTTVSNPGAGNQISTGASGRWVLVGFRASFTASATVATRYPIIRLSDGASHIMWSYATGPVTASQVMSVSGAIGASASSFASNTSSTSETVGLPDVMLPTSGVWDTTVNGMQTGDTWSSITWSYCYEDSITHTSPVAVSGTVPVNVQGTVPVTAYGSGHYNVDCASGCSGATGTIVASSMCPSKSGTTTTSSTTTTLPASEADPGELCTVNVATSAGFGLAGTTALGLFLFAAFAALVISFRHRRA